MEQDPTVLDLFCGAGGLSLGFIKAGFRVALAVDNNAAALDTYSHGIGNHTALLDLSRSAELPCTSVIAGGPPCQGFSSAGKRKFDDHRNSLVAHFAKTVALLRPKAFVFENVEGFLTAENGGRVLDLLDPVLKAGYKVHVRKINAANFGVPQHRKRVLALGGLGWEPTIPQPTHTAFGAPGALLASRHLPMCPTFAAAIDGLPSASPSPPGHPQGHFYRPLSSRDLERARLLEPGMTMRDLPATLQHSSYQRRAFRRVMDGTPSERRGGAPSGVRRLRFDEPSKAITGSAQSEFLHPAENRTLTLRECARLQTFPDSFEFFGTNSEQGQLIGNAVPPLLAHLIASSLAKDLKHAESSQREGALLSFVPTLSNGCSPALKLVTDLVNRTFRKFLVSEEMSLWR